jgi:hypothetical protein
MPTRSVPSRRQRRLHWKDENLSESVPHERRRECRRLLARLLIQVATAEMGETQEPQAGRGSRER